MWKFVNALENVVGFPCVFQFQLIENVYCEFWIGFKLALQRCVPWSKYKVKI